MTFTPAELAFLGALVNDRIEQLDADLLLLTAQAERLGVPLLSGRIVEVMAAYQGIAAKIEAAEAPAPSAFVQ